jgi:replication-associated recombination protein RarA
MPRRPKTAEYWSLDSVDPVEISFQFKATERQNMYFGQLKTASGYLNSECTSAMQKCIRRGLEEEALFWATELDLAGYGAYVWKRLRIIASEDIGMADPNVSVQVRALYENWVEKRKNKEDKGHSDRLFLVHAILICVRAKKSRMVDTALITMYEGDRLEREIPDFALDMHTSKGRAAHRGVNHFFTEGAALENAELALLPDHYLKRAWETRRKARFGDAAQWDVDE